MSVLLDVGATLAAGSTVESGIWFASAMRSSVSRMAISTESIGVDGRQRSILDR